jgi:hypothetical protein
MLHFQCALAALQMLFSLHKSKELSLLNVNMTTWQAFKVHINRILDLSALETCSLSWGLGHSSKS